MRKISTLILTLVLTMALLSGFVFCGVRVADLDGDGEADTGNDYLLMKIKMMELNGGVPVEYNNCEKNVSEEEFIRLVIAAGGTFTDGRGSSITSSNTASTASKPKHEHNYTSEITKEPTCVEPGERTYTCECGDTYTEEIAPTGIHDYVEEVTTEPTCVEPGVKTFTCSMCGDSYTEEIPALGHDFKETSRTEPTCTDEGTIIYACTRCGEEKTEVIPALGHDEGEWKVTKEAGWFTEGEQKRFCTRCQEVLETQVIPSIYPIWYLYIGIGILVAIVATISIIIKVKADKKDRIDESVKVAL